MNSHDSILINQIISDALNYDHIVIDGFAGFGGTTEGFERTENYKVIACINHWDKAIETHKKNHPLCLHIPEDFRTAKLSRIKYMVRKIRSLKPSIQVHLWLSLECTNFSNAKGGMPRDGDSRTLADFADRYVIALNPDVIWIENVKEFLMWGPMIPKVFWETNGVKKSVWFDPATDTASVFLTDFVGAYCPLVFNKKKKSFGPWMIPHLKQKGEDFQRWKNYIKSFGYDSAHKLLNAADYGVPQHRIRLFMCFTRTGVPAFFPKPTHHKKGLHGLPKWKAIRTCLDLEDEGNDLLSFKNGKPRIKSAKTIQRLMSGCIKHVLKGEEFFLTKYMGNNEHTGVNNGKPVSEPSVTVATSNRQAIVKANLIDYYFGNGYTIPDTQPAGVSGTRDGASVHTIQFISQANGENREVRNTEIDNAARTVTGVGGKMNLSSVKHVMKNYSGADADKNVSIENASGAITGKGGNAHLVTSLFIDQRYTSGQVNKSADEPAGAITGVPKQIVTRVEQFVMDTQFNNEAHSTEIAAHTVTANRKHYYIVNFQWFGDNTREITDVSNTIIARMDQKPSYLVIAETGHLAIEVYPHDPPHYRAMKKFMAANGIISIKMRMLKETELLKIQDLPADYKLTSSSTDNKKMIGNAVPPKLVEALANAYADGWKDFTQQKIAA